MRTNEHIVTGAAERVTQDGTGRRRGLLGRLSDWVETCADYYAASSMYDDLSRLSDAELQRRGLTRGSLARSICAATDRNQHSASTSPRTPQSPRSSRPDERHLHRSNGGRAMRHVSVPTNATARAFQLGALLVVGAFFMLILAHELASGPAPVAGPSKPFNIEPVASQTMDQHIGVP